MDICRQLSPNFGPRRFGLVPRYIVLHHTAMPCAQDAIARLCDPSAEVSAHYLISGAGNVTQMVEEADRAWHAGAGEWCGLDDLNSRSIGIELDNTGTHPFSNPQMQVLEQLLKQIMVRWNIGPHGVIGHSDMAPGRKFDPGPWFDWARLEKQGLAAPRGHHKLQAGGRDAFLRAAVGAGFTCAAPFEDVLSAVRLRFAPWRQGPLVAADFSF